MAFTNAGRFGPEAIIDGSGNKRANAQVQVFLTDGVTLATLYTDRTKSGADANPVLADGNGNLVFFADPGDYRLVVRYLGSVVATLDVTVPIDPIEAAQDTDVSDHLSDATDAHDASAISFTPVGTLASTNVQDAIAEAASEAAAAAEPIAAAHVADGTDAHVASAVGFTPVGTLGSTDVQAALAEVSGDVTTEASARSAADAAEAAARAAADSAHLADTIDAHDASAVSFTPAGTVAATDVQAAITEVATDAAADQSAHLADTVDAHDASAVSVTPTGAIASTDVQAALAELDSEKAAVAEPIAAAHIVDAVDAHAASAIGVTPTGNVAATTVQAAIAELDSEKATVAEPIAAAHIADGTDAHAASAIGFTPVGTIAATTVQAAIAEVASEASGSAAAVGYLDPTVSPYLVVADGVKVTDGVMASGSSTLTSASSAFTSALVGKTINVAMDDRVVNDGVLNSDTSLVSATLAFTATDVGKTVTISDRTANTTRASCTRTSGSAVVTCATAAAADAGRNITGTGIPSGTRVISVVVGVSFTLSANATASGTSTLTLKGYMMSTTIASVTNATTAVMAAAALWTGTASTVVITTPPLHTTISAAPSGTTLTLASPATVPYSAATVKYGTENGPGVSAAAIAGAAANRAVRWPAGRILCSAAVDTYLATVTPASGATLNAFQVGAGKDVTIFDVVARGVSTGDWAVFASANVDVNTTCNWLLRDLTIEYVGPLAADINSTNAPMGLHTQSGPCEVEFDHVRLTGLGQAHRQTAGQGAGVRRRSRYYDCDFIVKAQVVSVFNNVPSGSRTDAACTTTAGSFTVTDAAAAAGDVGKYVNGQGVPEGARVVSVSAGVSYTMNVPARASVSNKSHTIFSAPLDHIMQVRRCHFESTDPRASTPTDNLNNNHVVYIHANISLDATMVTTKASDPATALWHFHVSGGGSEWPYFFRIKGWTALGEGNGIIAGANGGRVHMQDVTSYVTLNGIDTAAGLIDIHNYSYYGAGPMLAPTTTAALGATVTLDGFLYAGVPATSLFIPSGYQGTINLKNGTVLPSTNASHALLAPGANSFGTAEDVTIVGNSVSSGNPLYAMVINNVAGVTLVARRCDFSGAFQNGACVATGASATGGDFLIEDCVFNVTTGLPIRDAVSTGTDGPFRGQSNRFVTGSNLPKSNGATKRRGNKVRTGRGVNTATVASAATVDLGVPGWNFDTHRITGTTPISTLRLGASIDETYMVGHAITLIFESTQAGMITAGASACQFAEGLDSVAGHAYQFIFDQSLTTPLWVRVG